MLLLAAGLALMPLSGGAAAAKDGGAGGGHSGSDGHGGGNSGSGGSGSGKGGSDRGSGSGHGGKGRSGKDDGGAERSERKGREQSRASRRARLDQVVWSARREGGIEVRYADGWSEKVDSSGYTLCDPGRRIVASRPAKPSDFSRLGAIAK